MTSRDDRLLTEAYEEISEAWYNNKSREEDIANRAGKEAHKVAGGKQGLAGVGQSLRNATVKGLGGRMKSGEQKEMNTASNARTTAIAKSYHDTFMEQLRDVVAELDAQLTNQKIDTSFLPRGIGKDIFKAIRNYQAPVEQEQQPQPKSQQTKPAPPLGRTGRGGATLADGLT